MLHNDKDAIERAADAIKFMVDLSHVGVERLGAPCELMNPGGWTDKGLRETRWPKDFSAVERRYIRRIVKEVLNAAAE